jgi:hypothetical protein
MFDPLDFPLHPHDETVFSLVPEDESLLEDPSIRHLITNVHDLFLKNTSLGLNFKWSEVKQGKTLLFSIGREGCTINHPDFDSSIYQCTIEYENGHILFHDRSNGKTTRPIGPSQVFFEEKLPWRTIALDPKLKFVFAAGHRHRPFNFTIVWHKTGHNCWLPPNDHLSSLDQLSPSPTFISSEEHPFRETSIALCSKAGGEKYVKTGLLGIGAFGTVETAYCIHTTRVFALKSYKPDEDNPAMKDSRRRERGLLGGISHVWHSCTR